MIIDKEVYVTVSGSNKPHYESLGYTLPYSRDNRGRLRVKKGSKILVDILHVHKTSNIKINYKCDSCGAVKETSLSSVIGRRNSEYNKSGKTFCSSCANKKMSGANNANYKHGSKRYPEYKNNAKRRNIDFNLSPNEFKSITSEPCHYCGGYSTDYDLKSRGNGIDRMDSSLGYTTDNCLPCCSKCNFLKNKSSYEDFINYIIKVYKNITKKKS